MSLPQTEHTCANCALKIGVSCTRKRKVIEGYCTEFIDNPKIVLGEPKNEYWTMEFRT